MNVQTAKAFRISIIVGVVAYTAYWFSPYFYGYLDPNIGAVLSYSGYEAIYPGNNIVDVAMFVMWIVGAFGMFFYRKIARCFFTIPVAFEI